ncbi:MAG: group II truncated hemoglobin [Gammaproteobacteria bacterium]|nr:group II truncated hemoglobin [Gammaproteobacteria bacterium]
MIDISNEQDLQFGRGDASYRAAGGEVGITRLVDDFYNLMGSDARFRPIYDMHPENITLSREKLAAFLCGWLGGPRLYQEKFGSIGIPAVHRQLDITSNERDQWLGCMSEAIAAQPYTDDFKRYLLEQLSVPASAIVRVCAQRRADE